MATQNIQLKDGNGNLLMPKTDAKTLLGGAFTGDDNSTADLDLSDGYGNVIARFEGGDLKTKNFDSSKSKISESNSDFNISDAEGNIILTINNGNIFSKNFTNAPLRGKRISFLGDSITTYKNYPGSNTPFYNGSNANVLSVHDTWWQSICDRQGAIVNRIYSHGGGNIQGDLCTHYGDLKSNGTTGALPDVIFILGGINDYGHGITLGTISDQEATNTTFYAAYKYLLMKLKETYPNAVIVGLTPLNSMYCSTTPPYYNDANPQRSIREFCNAIIECCDYFSNPYIDLNKLVNINAGNYQTLLADYTHPNNDGIKLMVKAIINNLINNIIL